MSKGVIWFLILAFAGAWIPWEIALRAGLPVGSMWFQIAALPGAFAPAVACIVVRKWITREGFGDAGLALNLRQWRYYVIALLLPFVVLGFVVIEAKVLSIATPDFSKLFVLSPLLALAAIVSTPLLWGEEFGWRGYLQMRLFVGRPLWAAWATGVIWAVWHYPVILRGYDYPGHPFDGAAVFTVATVLISIIFGWLRNATGSVWATSLAHAATNAIGGQLGIALFGHNNPVLVGYIGVLGLVPLGLLCIWIVWTGRLSRT
jgi:uncharacterized protein